MSLNDLNSKLTPRQVEIAIEAIGRRAIGTPAEAALQILLGVAVLEGGGMPAVAWPEGYNLIEKAKWHANQAAKLTDRNLRVEQFMSLRPAVPLSSTSCLEPEGERYPTAQADTPLPEEEAHEVRRAVPTEAVYGSGKKPDQVANDAFE